MITKWISFTLSIMNSSSSCSCLFFLLLLLLLLLCRKEATSGTSPVVQLNIQDKNVVIDNGIVQVTLSKAHGYVSGIRYHGIDNVLEIHNEEHDRGYWDLVGRKGVFDRLEETDFKVVLRNEDRVEVSFTKTWNPNQSSTLPLNVDKRYILRRGSSGFYMYGILERLKGWPGVGMGQIRIVFKLQNDKFHYMAISDDKQRIMPTPQERSYGRPLAYPEAVLLTRVTNRELKGEVDDKYQYSMNNEDNMLKGWISDDSVVGFWLITPSIEFNSGGPLKQDLTSHAGPVALSMFTSTHYAGQEFNTEYSSGEPWKKVFGPIFVYLNSNSGRLNSSSSVQYRRSLWDDAKRQLSVETQNWPYDFPQSKDFPSAVERGSVSGKLMVWDMYLSKGSMPATSAYVGLAAPGEVGSWQFESKRYQFWTRANKDGSFSIQNVRAGDYNLYAWVPNVIGEYKYEGKITVKPRSKTNMGVLKYAPPRNGPTLWEIGIPDRSAGEFFVPELSPNFLNRLFLSHQHDKFRQYGLWQRYTDLYPRHDLRFNIGVNNYSRDWFFAHVQRHVGNKTYNPTTWQITFGLHNINPNGNYTLQLALASAQETHLQVRFNHENAIPPHFSTGHIGKDNAIARHGIHGLYRLYSVNVPGHLLRQGSNTMYLTQARAFGPFSGIMYDYIRMEGPKAT